jgi:hypothetical protein
MGYSKTSRKMAAVRAVRPKSKRRPVGRKGAAVRSLSMKKGGRRLW